MKKLVVFKLFLISLFLQSTILTGEDLVHVNIKLDKNVFEPGEKIQVQIILVQESNQQRKDVIVEAILKDRNGVELSKNSQTIALEAQSSTLTEINVPSDSEDFYSLEINIRNLEDNIIIGKASEMITIKPKPFLESITYKKLTLTAIILFLIVLISFSFALYFYTKKMNIHLKKYEKVGKEDVLGYLNREK